MAITKPKPPERTFQQWRIDPPPATRFYIYTDGAIHLYFEKNRAMEMVRWADAQAVVFRQLASFCGVDVPPTGITPGTVAQIEQDPGYLLAMKQQESIDGSKGIDRKAKNEAPDVVEPPIEEMSNEEISEIPEEDDDTEDRTDPNISALPPSIPPGPAEEKDFGPVILGSIFEQKKQKPPSSDHH